MIPRSRRDITHVRVLLYVISSFASLFISRRRMSTVVMLMKLYMDVVPSTSGSLIQRSPVDDMIPIA
jgi:hypothetical protein